MVGMGKKVKGEDVGGGQTGGHKVVGERGERGGATFPIELIRPWSTEILQAFSLSRIE